MASRVLASLEILSLNHPLPSSHPPPPRISWIGSTLCIVWRIMVPIYLDIDALPPVYDGQEAGLLDTLWSLNRIHIPY